MIGECRECGKEVEHRSFTKAFQRGKVVLLETCTGGCRVRRVVARPEALRLLALSFGLVMSEGDAERWYLDAEAVYREHTE